MNAPQLQKDRKVIAERNAQGSSGGLFSWVLEPIGHYLIKKLDAGLTYGMIEGYLPDGRQCIVGGRGEGPTAIVYLNNWRALLRVARGGTVGWYEAWLAGEWESPNPMYLFDLFVRNRNDLGAYARPSGVLRYAGKMLNWFKRNNRSGSKKNIEFHYDLGNDFYTGWLDETMSYSSAIFDENNIEGESLEQAQQRKIDRLIDRLDLSDGDSLLEIGCGWGGLAQSALSRCDIQYHGITLSHEQKAFADHRLDSFGDNAQVTITDYRDVSAKYDAIASVEMVEAVGQEYWPSYLDCISNNLKTGGKAALQYIRIEDDVFDAYASGQDFIQRYIFPGGMLLSESRFRALAEERGLIWEEQIDYGLHYAETLRRWHIRFNQVVDDGKLPAGFDEKFIKLWRYYLMYCEGGFRGGGINVSQVTLTKN